MNKKLQCNGSDATGTHPQFIACGEYKVPPGFTATIEDGNVCIRPIPLTEFEEHVKRLLDFAVKCVEPYDIDCIKTEAEELLAIANRELEKSQWIKDMQEWWYNKGHTEGYWKGQKEAEERHNEASSFHMPIIPPTGYPPCYWGGPCTNPQHDCVNCPHQGASGVFKTNTKIE